MQFYSSPHSNSYLFHCKIAESIGRSYHDYYRYIVDLLDIVLPFYGSIHSQSACSRDGHFEAEIAFQVFFA